MNTGPSAAELLRLRDELDALDQIVPEGWGFRYGVLVASLFLFLLIVGALDYFPYAIIAVLFGALVVYERRVRRTRLLARREAIQRRIRQIEESDPTRSPPRLAP